MRSSRNQIYFPVPSFPFRVISSKATMEGFCYIVNSGQTDSYVCAKERFPRKACLTIPQILILVKDRRGEQPLSPSGLIVPDFLFRRNYPNRISSAERRAVNGHAGKYSLGAARF